jgi:hypothetical protein
VLGLLVLRMLLCYEEEIYPGARCEHQYQFWFPCFTFQFVQSCIMRRIFRRPGCSVNIGTSFADMVMKEPVGDDGSQARC